MLVELSVVEQGYLAVREVLDSGARIKDVAIRYGVDHVREAVRRLLQPPSKRSQRVKAELGSLPGVDEAVP